MEMYHVTDAGNVAQIMEEGLQPGADDKLYLTETAEDARFLGEVYPTITDPVVLEATVRECHVEEGPGDAGDVHEYVKHGPVYRKDLEVVDE